MLPVTAREAEKHSEQQAALSCGAILDAVPPVPDSFLTSEALARRSGSKRAVRNPAPERGEQISSRRSLRRVASERELLKSTEQEELLEAVTTAGAHPPAAALPRSRG